MIQINQDAAPQMGISQNSLTSFLHSETINLLFRKCQSPLPLAFAFLLLQAEHYPVVPLKNSFFSLNED